MIVTRSIADLVQAHPLFRDLAPDIVGLIAGCGQNGVFSAGAYLCREGETADYFYLIREGRVALESFIPGRGPVVFQTLKAGDMIGLSWLVPPYRWQFDGRVQEEVHTIGFDARCLRDKCEADPHIGYALMKRFVAAMLDRIQSARLQALDVYGADVSGARGGESAPNG